MPATRRLTADEKEAIRTLLAEGATVAELSRRFGRSKDTIARLARGEGQTKAKFFHLRMTEAEFEALQEAAAKQEMTASDYARRVLRGGAGQLALSEEITLELEETRRELSAIGKNLNQLATLGNQGKLRWNPGDARLVQSTLSTVVKIGGQFVKVVLAARTNVALDVEKVAKGLAL